MKASQYRDTVKPASTAVWTHGQTVGPERPEPTETEKASLEREANDLLADMTSGRSVQDATYNEYVQWLLNDMHGATVHIRQWRILNQPHRSRLENRLKALADAAGLDYARVSKRGRYGGTYIRIGNRIRSEIHVSGNTNAVPRIFEDTAARQCKGCNLDEIECLVCSGNLETVDSDGQLLYSTVEVFEQYVSGKAARKLSTVAKLNRSVFAWNRPTPLATVPLADRPLADRPPDGRQTASTATVAISTAASTTVASTAATVAPYLVKNGVPSRAMSLKARKRFARFLM